MPGPATDHYRKRKSRRWFSPRRVGFWLLATLVAGVLAGSLLLPTLVRSAATDFAREAFGVHLEIGTVRVNPLTLALRLTDLYATTPAGATVATAEHIELALHPASAVRHPWWLRSGAIRGASLHDPGNGPGKSPGNSDAAPDEAPWLRIDTIALSGGRYRAREHDLHIDTMELRRPGLRMHADRAWPWHALTPHDAMTRADLPHVELSRLRAIDLSVEIIDQRPDPPARLQLDALDVTLTDFASAESTAAPVQVEGSFSDGGGLSLDGALTLLPEPHLGGDIEIDGFALRQLAGWMPEMDIVSGRLFLGGQLEISTGEPLGYSGRVDVDDLQVTAGEDETASLRWRQLYSERLALSLGRQRLEAQTLTLDAPEMRIRFSEDGVVHIGPVRIPARPGGTPAHAAPAPATVVAGSVRVTDGRLDISDPAAEPTPLDTSLHALTGSMSRLATGATRPTRMRLSGYRADGEPAGIDARVWLPAQPRAAEAELHVREPGVDRAAGDACYRITADGFTAACSRRMPDR